MIMGPNDSRALRDTGRTWERDGLSGPIMVDGHGREYEVIRGSVADFTNGRLDRIFDYLERRHPLAAAVPPLIEDDEEEDDEEEDDPGE